MQDKWQLLCKRGLAWRNHTCRIQRQGGLQIQFLSPCCLHRLPHLNTPVSWIETLPSCPDSRHLCLLPCSFNQLQITYNFFQEVSSPKLHLMPLLTTPTVSSTLKEEGTTAVCLTCWIAGTWYIFVSLIHVLRS